MTKAKNPEKVGVSLRTLFICIIIFAVIISAVMVYFTFHLSRTFAGLSDATEEYIDLEKAAYELMDASDYLTEKVQRFTIDGNTQYMDEYFIEADQSKHREDALEKMSLEENSAEAFSLLQEAMRQSLELMKQEYYAMRLVVEAKGYTDYPAVLDDYTLSAEDAALSSEDKMRRATELVLGDSYYEVKDLIRANMKDSLDSLEELTRSAEQGAMDDMKTELIIFRIAIVIQTLGILLMIWLTSRLGISPVLQAVDRIKDNETIPEIGANEFRYLARTYNKMYRVYKRSVERLNYKASHDVLTGVYNRSGYELLISGLDLSSTYFLIFDIDDFKLINDNHGHEMGDKALKKTAQVIKNNFRADDYVCRIGGDEFVVFMVHADPENKKLIESKVNQINLELADDSDGVQAFSVSAGASHGHMAADATALFNQADKALYVTKRNGKKSCNFYTP